jgi:hypothetical protein
MCHFGLPSETQRAPIERARVLEKDTPCSIELQSWMFENIAACGMFELQGSIQTLEVTSRPCIPFFYRLAIVCSDEAIVYRS